MATVIKRTLIYQLLFALCVGVPYLNNYELTFAVWSFVAIITIQKKYTLSIVSQLICFSTILIIAIVVSFFKEYRAYFLIRDITYMSKPIFGIMIGYQICSKNFQKVFQTIIYTGLFIAIVHLIILFIAVVFYKASTVNDLRFYGGYFSDFEVYSLIICFFYKKFEIKIPFKNILVIGIVIGFSSFMYLARTNFIQFIILFLAMKGFFVLNKKSITIIASLILAGILAYSAILYINPRRNGHGLEALLYKIKIAPTEPFKTKINREDWKDFNDNYRSYENIMTVRQMTREGIGSVTFGQGIGSQIDLKQKVWLGDMELRYISILHNGFMTIFLKSGLLGLFIYLISIFLLFRKSYSEIPIIQNIDLLLLGTGIFLFFSNWVFMGFYNLLDSKSIFIGTIICYRAMTIKSHSNQIIND